MRTARGHAIEAKIIRMIRLLTTANLAKVIEHSATLPRTEDLLFARKYLLEEYEARLGVDALDAIMDRLGI